MECLGKIRKLLFLLAIVLLAFFHQATPAQASGALIVGERGRHHDSRGYAEVIVSGSRYYYDQGIFYTGQPGNYVAVEAPPGAIVYNVPAGCERVEVDGAVYFVYNDVYYRPVPQGYEVVRIKEPHDRGRHRGGEHDRGHDHERRDDDR